jgi:hypothetical protein
MSLATLQHYAVPAILLVTTLGALVIALVMFRWGSTGSDDAPDDELGSEVDDASREFVSMVRRDRTARRARALRFGHVVAIACFAAAASLAVIAMNRAPLREPATTTGPGAARAADAQTAAELQERVRTLEERLVVAESRAAAASVPPTSGGAAAAPPQQPAGESSSPRTPPAASAPPSKASPEPPATAITPSAQPGPRPPDATDGRKAAARTESQPPTPSRPAPELPAPREGAPQKGTGGRPGTASSALPRGVAGPTATVGNVRVEILRQPERSSGGAPASYAIRLTDLRGSPLADADVSILARMGDGTTAQGVLEATENAGTYTGDVLLGPTGPWDLRLRIARRQTTFELPLASPTSW